MAIFYDNFQQGSAEWYTARLGIPTASSFDKIVTPARGEFSKQSRAYCYYLVAEMILHQPLETISHLEWVNRGREMEPLAVQQYKFTEDADVQTVGFCTTDDGLVGASPDRLLLDANGDRTGGALEVKCPSPQVHLAYLIDGPGDAYKCQVQGQLYVCELDFVNFFSWHPQMPPVLIPTYRDEPFIAKLRQALGQFQDLKNEVVDRCRRAGFFDPKQTLVQRPIDIWAAQDIG